MKRGYLLSGILSPETIQTLVDNGVIDVIKRCSMDGCKDIAYDLGPYTPAYLMGAVTVVGLSGGAIALAAQHVRKNNLLPSMHNVSLNPINFFENILGAKQSQKPSA